MCRLIPSRTLPTIELLAPSNIVSAKISRTWPEDSANWLPIHSSMKLLPRIINAPDWLFNNLFLKKWKIDAKARSSMADDLAAGRKTEIDYLNGELVRLAERLQRDAPVNRAIVELVRKAEEGAKPLGPVALRKAVLGR